MDRLHVVPGGEDAGRADAAPIEPLMRDLLGDTLRAVRRRQGRTLKEVAAAADVSMTYLSEIERGHKEASSEVVGAVTRALGGSLIDLLAEMSTLLVVTSTTDRPVAPAAAVPARSLAVA